MKRMTKFAIAIVLTGAIALGWMSATSGKAVSLRWKPISAAPPALIAQFKQDIGNSTESRLNLSGTQFLKIEQPQQIAPLFLIDTSPTFRTAYRAKPALCGRQSCLFSAYIFQAKRYRRVANGYLTPLIPKETTLIEVADRLTNGLPCLTFNQPKENAPRQLNRLSYCFDRVEYKQIQGQP